jgi:cysteine desulfurase/selenocysteine lyase
MHKDALFNKNSFIGLDSSTWFYSGAESPPLIGCMEALNQYMNNRGKGPIGRERHSEVEQSLRSNIAELLNGRSEDIALISNSSEGISIIIHSIGLQAGDNLVINTLDFPSAIFQSLMLQEKGIEVRLVDHTNWQISIDDIMQHVDSRTKLVMTSHVSFVSGARLDYRGLYERLQETNVLLFLDATQSLGAVSVDIQSADFIICSSYKWLLSIHGLGILAVNPVRTSHIIPNSAGWRSVVELFYPDRFISFEFQKDARRFELGYPSYPSIYVMNFSTNLILQTGVERVERHIADLGGYLIKQLQRQGRTVFTPVDSSLRAGNISFACENAGVIAERLLEQEIYVWGGDGRIRASAHVFNDIADVDRLMEAISNEINEESGSY